MMAMLHIIALNLYRKARAKFSLRAKDAEMIDLIYDFCEAVNLPTTFADIGLGEVSDEDLMKAAKATTVEGETIHNELGTITAQMVFNALRAADQIGRTRKGQ